MSRRKRKAIRKDEYLAAALSLLLPYEDRTALRRAKVPARTILAMFSPDHIELHALGGSDAWHNLHPTLRGPHKEKSRRDTSICAKVDRIIAKRARPARAAAARAPKPAGAAKMVAKPRNAPASSARASRWPRRDRCWRATPPRDIRTDGF